jgi:soluble lytic murein transglycosylase-like protein
VFFAVLMMADAGWVPPTETPPPLPGHTGSTAHPPSPHPRSSPPLPPLSAAYREAADALRRRDCTAAFAELEPLVADDSPEAPFARVVQGLYAHACERPDLAEQRLFLGGGPGTPFEDWRLLVLADSASAAGHTVIALAALTRLFETAPDTPLRARALAKATEVAWAAGDAGTALGWIERGREELEGAAGGAFAETLVRLDALAWEIGRATARPEVQRLAGRRLLAAAPERAEELAVEAFFRAGGELSGTSALTVAELEQRARALADLKRFDEAVEALEAVPPSRRGLTWHLRTAELLSRDHRGGEALEVLAAVAPADRRQAAALAWERARAWRDLSHARRGRSNLASAERRKAGERARELVRQVVEIDPEGELAEEALRRLFRDLASDDRFDEALVVLGMLRRLDPGDQTGTAYLWRQGWESYRRRNPSGAIGYWAELASLYPESSAARSGRYWTGRAYEALGERSRAGEIFREVATADTTDFYRKYALTRLRGAALPDPAAERLPGQTPEPWPQDPRLARSALLSDLGLDDLALAELEALRTVAEPPLDGRAADALESRLLARKGDPRSSIRAIRRAFPALGGPHQAAVPQEALRLYYPLAFEETVRAQAERRRLPVHVLLGMIRQESGFDPTAHSRAGARGLMQLMPATGREVARRMGLAFSSSRLSDPAYNLSLGTAYFRQVLSMFDDNLELALAGYNGGPYRIRRLWRQDGGGELDTFLEGLGVEESRIYVKRILVLSDSYQEIYGLPSRTPSAAASAAAPARGAGSRASR